MEAAQSYYEDLTNNRRLLIFIFKKDDEVWLNIKNIKI